MPDAIRCALAAALAAALSTSWLPAAAQSQAGAADPAAAVPATTYRPAIQYRPEAEPGATPDRTWADSNATVAAYNSMALTMKMKRMPAQADPHAAHVGHAHHGEAAPAAPAPGESP